MKLLGQKQLYVALKLDMRAKNTIPVFWDLDVVELATIQLA